MPVPNFSDNLPPSDEGHPTTLKSNPTSRNIILCFDGTGNKFGRNSNVVRLFHSLIKDDERQLVYYQPGIGTYNKRQTVTHTANGLLSAFDQAFAYYISDHIKEGYQYIMRNYRVGDRIYLFGFSRGAHTARVVAGMLYKVGILPPHNDQQLDFAYEVYQTKHDDGGYELGKEFKETFAYGSFPPSSDSSDSTQRMPVTVEFVGVWDTVSSVGLVPRSHPYTSVNYAVKHFRHALALDERRSRFRPNFWSEETVDPEKDLDVDEPKFEPIRDRNTWVYKPPDRDICDVQEVWFAGCHADVGGGSHIDKIRDSLSYIPLRWMIKECMSVTEILFDPGYLSELGIDLPKLAKEVIDIRRDSVAELGFNLEDIANAISPSAVTKPAVVSNAASTSPRTFWDYFRYHQHTRPLITETHHPSARLYDQLEEVKLWLFDPIFWPIRPLLWLIHRLIQPSAFLLTQPFLRWIPIFRVFQPFLWLIQPFWPIGPYFWALLPLMFMLTQILDWRTFLPTKLFSLIPLFWTVKPWWLVECIPTLRTYQDPKSGWMRTKVRGFGEGRYLPSFGNKVKVHISVKDRENYIPRAYNWKVLEESKMITWVT